MRPDLGLDVGATWVRACLADGKGRILRRDRLPAVPWSKIVPVIGRLKKKWRVRRLNHLTIGATRLGLAKDREKLLQILRPLADSVAVLTDVELAFESALPGKVGIVAVAGTGSIAWARNKKGENLRAGGLGPLLGDEGSAFWIGREALKDPSLKKFLPNDSALRLAHNPEVIRKTAALALPILRKAKSSAAARRLRLKAASAVAGLVIDLGRRLRFEGNIPVSWQGGLFRDPGFLGDFKKSLAGKGRIFKPRPPSLAPDEAAATLARNRVKSNE